MNSRIVVLTGALGIGKTTLCEQLVSLLRQDEVDVAGIVSPPLFENDIKTGILIRNVRTREERCLAERANLEQSTDNLRWRFDPANMQWGTEILRTAIPCDILIIDELGPLELIHGKGWSIAFDILQTRNYRAALVVVRPSLIPKFEKRVKEVSISIMTMTVENRVSIRDAVQSALLTGNT